MTRQEADMTKKTSSEEKIAPKKVQLQAAPLKKAAVDAPMAQVVVAPAAAVVSAPNAKSDDPSEAKAEKILVKKQEFVDRVVSESGMKKSEVKPAMEAALRVLLYALQSGEELQLPPLGKIKVQNVKDVGFGSEAMTLKLRTPKKDQA
jgi:hypothetical protein